MASAMLTAPSSLASASAWALSWVPSRLSRELQTTLAPFRETGCDTCFVAKLDRA